jgi:hypothetical protein
MHLGLRATHYPLLAARYFLLGTRRPRRVFGKLAAKMRKSAKKEWGGRLRGRRIPQFFAQLIGIRFTARREGKLR